MVSILLKFTFLLKGYDLLKLFALASLAFPLPARRGPSQAGGHKQKHPPLVLSLLGTSALLHSGASSNDARRAVECYT